MGISNQATGGGDEENWLSGFRCEVKAGGQVAHLWALWRKLAAPYEADRPLALLIPAPSPLLVTRVGNAAELTTALLVAPIEKALEVVTVQPATGRPFVTAYTNGRKQSDRNLPHDARPFVFAAMPAGVDDGLNVWRKTDTSTVAMAFHTTRART